MGVSIDDKSQYETRFMPILHIKLHNDEGYEQLLNFNQQRLKYFTKLSPCVISIAGAFSPERKRVERFIEDTFKNSYGAAITRHYPVLMSVRDAQDTILGALGFRYAKEEPLFLEQYLSTTIETAHQEKTGEILPRALFVESGNLASSGNGASIFLFTAMHAYLLQHGFHTVAVTATDFLHRYFLKLGITPHMLSIADQNLLPDAGASWGSYYLANPRVVTGNIADTYAQLKRHLKLSFSGETEGLRTRIHPKPDGQN